MIEVENIIDELGGRSYLEESLIQNIEWINKSFAVNNNEGSSASQNLFGRWSQVYPETTGYLISTILKTQVIERKEKMKLAFSQLLFLEKIKNEDGSFYQSMDNKEPIVFDTAQILLGLISIAPLIAVFGDVVSTCSAAHEWLYAQLNEKGEFKKYNYVKDYNPAYYSRIAWPMVAWESINEKKPREKTVQLIKRICQLQNENLSFNDWGFYPEQKAYTHTIAYTLRGLYECGLILNDNEIKDQVCSSLRRFIELVKRDNRVGGAYDLDWQADTSFICATGNAQLALLLMMVYRHKRENIFLEIVPKLLKPLVKAQRSWYNRAAVPSSIPIWGPYQRFKYTNWTQKFYSEALTFLLNLR